MQAAGAVSALVAIPHAGHIPHAQLGNPALPYQEDLFGFLEAHAGFTAEAGAQCPVRPG